MQKIHRLPKRKMFKRPPWRQNPGAPPVRPNPWYNRQKQKGAGLPKTEGIYGGSRKEMFNIEAKKSIGGFFASHYFLIYDVIPD